MDTISLGACDSTSLSVIQYSIWVAWFNGVTENSLAGLNSKNLILSSK